MSSLMRSIDGALHGARKAADNPHVGGKKTYEPDPKPVKKPKKGKT